jgi:flavin reductase (DIM6/NTAB) family NADH-FMN oxidoreductase RutF
MSARAGGSVVAMTADTFTTVSLDPPVVLVSVALGGYAQEVIAAAGGYAVSVLSSIQEPLARRLADPGRPRDAGQQLGSNAWCAAPLTGAPLLPDALGWLDCQLREFVPVADRVLVLGDVIHAAIGPPAAALVRYLSEYRWLRPH